MKNIKRKNYTKKYLTHLHDTFEQQKKFDAKPCRETAIPLSNMKNNMFQSPDEVFKEEFIPKALKKLKKKAKKDNIELTGISWEPMKEYPDFIIIGLKLSGMKESGGMINLERLSLN